MNRRVSFGEADAPTPHKVAYYHTEAPPSDVREHNSPGYRHGNKEGDLSREERLGTLRRQVSTGGHKKSQLMHAVETGNLQHVQVLYRIEQ